MVSITVILAAVIAAFAFGMTSNSYNTKNVAFTIKRTGTNTAEVTYMNPGNSNTVSDLSTSTSGVTWIGSVPTGTLYVGSTWKMNVPITKTDIVLTAIIDNGDRVVVLDAVI